MCDILKFIYNTNIYKNNRKILSSWIYKMEFANECFRNIG